MGIRRQKGGYAVGVTGRPGAKWVRADSISSGTGGTFATVDSVYTAMNYMGATHTIHICKQTVSGNESAISDELFYMVLCRCATDGGERTQAGGCDRERDRHSWDSFENGILH